VIPGGVYGVLPLGKETFKSTVRMTNLGGGVSARSVSFSNPVLIRAQFVGDPERPTISFLLPCIRGDQALLNGREVSGNYVLSSNGGAKHQFRTKGVHEVGTIAVTREAMLEAYDTFIGGRVPACLKEDSNIRSAPALIDRLNALHRQAGELLRTHNLDDLQPSAAPAVALMRDTVLATLARTIGGGEGKPDHLATRRQTASMARLDRYIDDHPYDLSGLQDLCNGTGMALRTVETIIRTRTGMSALNYLRRRRLAFVRQALLAAEPGTTITEVALSHGFLHLGRFSGEYREAFGESPSATLTNALR